MKVNKKEILDSSITFPAGHYSENINIFNEKLINRLFSLQWDVQNFFFSLKYRQRKNAKNRLFSLQYGKENFIFTYSYRIRKFHFYGRIYICGKILLSYV